MNILDLIISPYFLRKLDLNNLELEKENELIYIIKNDSLLNDVVKKLNYYLSSEQYIQNNTTITFNSDKKEVKILTIKPSNDLNEQLKILNNKQIDQLVSAYYLSGWKLITFIKSFYDKELIFYINFFNY